MTRTRPKVARLRLDPVAYENLRRQVLRRDGWRCQNCGTMSNLEVHHQEYRSGGGEDAEPNLITLCAICHGQVHTGRIRFGVGDRLSSNSCDGC